MKRFLQKKFIFVLTAVFFTVFLLLTVVYIKSGEQERDIRINEICTSNFSVSSDNAGNYEDYIELVNTGEKEHYLSGFKIRTVKGKNSTTVRIPDFSMAPGEYRMIFTSEDYDTGNSYDADASLDLKEFLMTGSFFKKETGDELHLPVNLSKEGLELFLINPGGEVIDRAEVPQMSYDSSFSRYPDSTGDFSVRTSSPGETNDGTDAKRVRVLKEPEFSATGGFYDSEITLSMTAGTGEKIYYTLDGSDPDENSIPYTGPIVLSNPSENENVFSGIEDVSPLLTKKKDRYAFSLPSEKVDKAVVIKAAVSDGKGQLGKIRTESFFIGLSQKKYKDTAVISVVSDPEGLFSEDKGIYVLGDAGHEYRKENPGVVYWGIANYRFHGREWERQADISFFDEEHKSVLNDSCGIRVKGNWSRCFPQKSLNLYARNIYSGSDRFSAEFLKGDGKESSVSLFSGGTDLDYKILDRLGASLAEGLNLSVMRFRPVHLFLNGEYWGIMYIADKFSNDYISRKYRIDPGNILLIKDHQAEDGNKEDEELYYELRYAAYSGLEDDASYAKFKELVDIDSMTDYYAFELYIGAQNDWPSRNVALWRSKIKGYNSLEDCKWRYILYDLNHKTMDLSQLKNDNIEKALEDDVIFAAAFKNREFRNELFIKMRAMEKVFCSPEAVDRKSRELEEDSVYHMGLWYERFYDGAVGEEGYRSKIQEIRDYFKERRRVVEGLIDKYDGT